MTKHANFLPILCELLIYGRERKLLGELLIYQLRALGESGKSEEFISMLSTPIPEWESGDSNHNHMRDNTAVSLKELRDIINDILDMRMGKSPTKQQQEATND